MMVALVLASHFRRLMADPPWWISHSLLSSHDRCLRGEQYIQSQLYKQSAQYLSNDGRNDQEIIRGSSIDNVLKTKRLEDSERRLEQIGKLIDVPRQPEEVLKLYLERLKPIFEQK